MFPASLGLLMRLQARGFFRKLGRGLREPRKAMMILLVYIGPMLSLLIFPILTILSGSEPIFQRITTEQLALLFFALFALSVVSSSFQFPLVFTSPEIQFLFPAPLTRRHLRGYKLVVAGTMGLYLSVMFGTLVAGFTAAWPRAILGLELLALFVLGSAVTAGQIARDPRGRKAVFAAFAIILVFIGWELAPAYRMSITAASPAPVTEVLDVVRSTVSYRVAVATMSPFAAMITSPLGTATLIAFGMAASALALALLLDVDMQERSLEASRRREAALERMRSGRIGRGAGAAAARLRIPMLPRLGGAGPTLHRHLLTFFRERTTSYALFASVILGAAAGFYFQGLDSGPSKAVAVGGAVYITFILSAFLRFDFRGDYSLLDHLKTLPVHPMPLAAGTVAAPAIITFILQCLPVTIFTLASGAGLPPLHYLALLLPGNLIYFALDNAIYLRTPTPPQRGMSTDPTAAGREMISMMAKGLVLMLVGGLAAGAHVAVRMVSGIEWAAWAVTWLVAAAFSVWFAWLAGVAFRDLDLGRDRL